MPLMAKRKADEEEMPLTLKRVKTTDDKVNTLQKKVNRISRTIETNYVDVDINKAVAYDVETVVHLTPIINDAATASGYPGTRQGSRVTPTFLEIRMQAYQGASTLQNPSFVRFLVVQAKQRFVPQTTSVSGTTAVLANQGSNKSYVAPFNKDNRRHFTVLHDETVSLGSWLSSSGSATAIPQARHIEIKRKLSRNIAYDLDSTTTEAGQVYLIAYSNIVSTQTEPTISGLCRVHYQDL